MVARQNQGFWFENLIDTMIESFTLSEGHTDKDDGFLDTVYLGSVPVSAKNTSRRQEICLGDMTRIINTDNSVLMFNGRHLTGQPEPEAVFVHYLEGGFAPLFKDKIEDAKKVVEDLRKYMSDANHERRCIDEENVRESKKDSSITYYSPQFDSRWRTRLKGYKRDYFDLYDGMKNISIHPRAKRSKSTQSSRLQCAMPYRFLDSFAHDHLKMLIEYYDDGTLKVKDYMKDVGWAPDEDHQRAKNEGMFDMWSEKPETDAYGTYMEYGFYGPYDGLTAEERAWAFVEEALHQWLGAPSAAREKAKGF